MELNFRKTVYLNTRDDELIIDFATFDEFLVNNNELMIYHIVQNKFMFLDLMDLITL